MEPTWPKLVEPLERITDRLNVVWGAVSHLKAVRDNEDLRSAVEEVQVDTYYMQFYAKSLLDIYMSLLFLWVDVFCAVV